MEGVFRFVEEAVEKREPLPSFRFAKCHLPRRWRPWQRGQVSPSPVTGQKKPAVKLQTFCLCQSLSLSGEVARRSRDGEGSLPFSAVGKDSLARFPLKTVQKNAPVCYTSLCASGFCAAAQFCGGEKPPKTTLWWFLDGVQGLRRVGTAGCPMGRSGCRSFSGENDCSTWNIETFPGRGRNRAWQRSLRSQTKRAV